MLSELTLPRLTDRMVSGRLVAWLKREGDYVEAGGPTCLVETDGAVMTVASARDGVLSRTVAEAGSMLPVGALLGYLAIPAADGMMADLADSAAGRTSRTASPGVGVSDPVPWTSRKEPSHLTGPEWADDQPDFQSGVVLPGTVFMEVDMTDALAVRERLMGRWESAAGVPLSLNHMVIKATAIALGEHPEVVRTGSRYALRLPPEVDVAVAIFDGGDVVTPVVRHAGRLPLVEISVQMAAFGERAAEHRLAGDNLDDVAVTVVNLGRYGADAAILSALPTPAVLGVGRCMRKPAVVDDDVRSRWMLALNLSFDGRRMDGARAAQLLGFVRAILEKPSAMEAFYAEP